MSIITLVQLFIMRLLCFELFYNVGHKSVFIIRDIHHIEVFTQQVFDCTHLGSRNNLTLGDTCLADFTLFTEHVRKFRIARLDSFTTIFDGNLLVINQHCSYNCNIDFFPAIQNFLITALYICHRGRQFLCILHLQILFHFYCSIVVFFHSGHYTI